MTLRMTAIASLALPSAVCVSLRVQSHWSHFGASFGNVLPQYGHCIVSMLITCSCVGASVYSTLAKVNKTR